MNILIIYESQYGNTKEVALAMGEALTPQHKLHVKQVSETVYPDIEGMDLLIIGCPTQGGQPTKIVQKFIDQIPVGLLKNITVATFDTRLEESKQNLAVRLLLKTIGYAAEKMAKILESKGGNLIKKPEGFMVTGKFGPLKENELKRAAAWVKEMKKC